MPLIDAGPTPRHPSSLGPEFEDTEANTELPPEVKEIWRDSSIELEHGLDVDELPIDSLPGEWRDSFR